MTRYWGTENLPIHLAYPATRKIWLLRGTWTATQRPSSQTPLGHQLTSGSECKPYTSGSSRPTVLQSVPHWCVLWWKNTNKTALKYCWAKKKYTHYYYLLIHVDAWQTRWMQYSLSIWVVWHNYIKCQVNSLVWKQVNRGWRVKNSGTSYEYANTAFKSHLFEGEGAHSTECKETHSKLSEAVCY